MIAYEKMLDMCQSGNYTGLEEALKENIREELVAKQHHGRGRAPKTDRIIASMMKKSADDFRFGKKNHPYGEYQCFLDGHRIFMDKETDYGYDTAEGCDRFDVSAMVDRAIASNDRVITVDRLALDFFIKTHKRNVKYPYVIRIGGKASIGFDPRYLKDMLDFTDTSDIYVDMASSGEMLTAPAMAYSDPGRARMALCLPVHLKPAAEYEISQDA